MDATEWLGLKLTHNPNRWILPVTPGISAGGQFLFGGCGLGAAIAALEETSGRPLVWATAQYLSYAPPPSILDLDVTIVVAGKQITQARAVGHVGDREILTVNAALGHRDLDAEGMWVTMPDGTASPNACVSRSSSPRSTPAWTRAVRRSGSTRTPFIGERSIISASSATERPGKECPPLRTATVRPLPCAAFTAVITSATPAQRTIAAGRRSNEPFQIRRCSS